MDSKQLLSLYGLKWNPFLPDVPIEALIATKETEHFCWRVENLVMDGGFALITGESGMGKSVAVRLLYERLSALRDITVAEFTRPQSRLADFYRELGSLFGVELRISNRWGGFSALRQKWQSHIENTLLRPLLIVDEAQEMQHAILSELRLLSSMRFDSQIILTTVLCGDSRLSENFKCRDLIALGNRIRTRLTFNRWDKDKLVSLLTESIERAGSRKLMTEELIHTLAEHSAGTPRIMMNIANELLMHAAKQELKQLDEKLYFEVFAPDAPARIPRKRKAA